MKYFRFLFEETNGCFMHFVELTETDTEEQIRILYLKSIEKAVNRQKDSMGFVCPAHVDLVVLGNSDAKTRKTWQKLSEQTDAEVLVFAGEDSGEDLKAGKVIRLSEQKPFWRWKRLGWNVFLKSYEVGSVVMMHGLDSVSEDRTPIVDCVMSVKATNHCRRCHTRPQPDGYGCALGCVLHQDYDLCKYQGNCSQLGQLTGTLLLAGTGDSDTIRQIRADAEQQPWRLRFLALPMAFQKAELFCKGGDWDLSMEGDCKTYYISMDEELNAAFVKQICEKGYYHIPVVPGKEQGLCCSGLMKYQEK